jgi:hypothetical protein
MVEVRLVDVLALLLGKILRNIDFQRITNTVGNRLFK